VEDLLNIIYIYYRNIVTKLVLFIDLYTLVIFFCLEFLILTLNSSYYSKSICVAFVEITNYSAAIFANTACCQVLHKK